MKEKAHRHQRLFDKTVCRRQNDAFLRFVSFAHEPHGIPTTIVAAVYDDKTRLQVETEILVVVLPVHVSAVGLQRQRSRADLHTEKTESADRLLVHRTQVAKTFEGEFSLSFFFFLISVLDQRYYKLCVAAAPRGVASVVGQGKAKK